MKKWLFAWALFTGILLVDVWTEPEKEVLLSVVTGGDFLTEQRDATDTGHRLEILSNELKGRMCVLPRRTVQWVNNTVPIRTLRGYEKAFLLIRLKGENRLRKVSEAVSDGQTANYFTLLSRRGYYIYTLRRLLI
ncbi:MAG: hypothetical protein LBT83_02125 [Tannerella sp.]|jgi:hypothetical protein|nr:hypothetical protein [Tannerella sp.]